MSCKCGCLKIDPIETNELVTEISDVLHKEIDLAILVQLSMLRRRVIGLKEIKRFGVKEVHPDGRWVFKWKGIPLVEVTPPSFTPWTAMTWKAKCLPIECQRKRRRK